jgi:hypothetical protein
MKTEFSKPIKIEKNGRKFFLSVNGAPLVQHAGQLAFDRSLAGIGKETIPAGLPLHAFKSKADARGIAHQIGRYMLKLGDFVDTYVEYADAPKTEVA